MLDTGPAGDFLNRRNGGLDRARAAVARGNRVGPGVPALAELVAGLERSASRDRNMQRLRTGTAALRLWPFDEAAAFEYGRLHADLVRIGRPMQTVDVMVAAIALSLGDCVVVTVDSDLSAVPGLRVEDWRVQATG